MKNVHPNMALTSSVNYATSSGDEKEQTVSSENAVKVVTVNQCDEEYECKICLNEHENLFRMKCSCMNMICSSCYQGLSVPKKCPYERTELSGGIFYDLITVAETVNTTSIQAQMKTFEDDEAIASNSEQSSVQIKVLALLLSDEVVEKKLLKALEYGVLPKANAQQNEGARYDDMALSLLRENAQKGDARAINEIGLRYLHGNGVVQDEKMALNLFFVTGIQGFNEGWSYINSMPEKDALEVGQNDELTETMKALVEANVRRNGYSEPYLTTNKGNVDVVKACIDAIVKLAEGELIAPKWIVRLFVDAIGDLVKRGVISKDYAVSLLQARPGLYIALEKGHHETVKVYIDVVETFVREKIITKKFAASLLEAKDRYNSPGLHRAFALGHHETVKVYIDAVENFVREKIISKEGAVFLLQARKDGMSGLFTALKQGHHETVKAYIELIRNWLKEELINKEDVASLLQAKMAFGKFVSQQFINVIQNLNREEATTIIGIDTGALTLENAGAILQASKLNGLPGLYIALEKGNHETVKVYIDAVENFVREEIITKKFAVSLLEAKDRNGFPGLFVALQSGRHETVKAYINGIGDLVANNRITSKWAVSLLKAKSKYFLRGVDAARANKEAVTVAFFTGEIMTLLDNGVLSKKQGKSLLEPSVFYKLRRRILLGF